MSLHRGARVKIAAHTDMFMMGETRAEVISLGRLWIYVKGERSGRTFMFRKSSMNDDIPPLEVCD